MESSLELGADLVLIQEAPVYQGWQYPMYDYIWGGQVITGMWRDSVSRVQLREDLVQPGEGDMQILDVVCRGHQQVWVVNVYDALRMGD
jgi:hypothetical protein